MDSAGSPFFALLSRWNGQSDSPLGVFGGYETSLKVYDETGGIHYLTVHYDPVDTSALSNAGGGESYWEYLVTMDPEEDGRRFRRTARTT